MYYIESSLIGSANTEKFLFAPWRRWSDFCAGDRRPGALTDSDPIHARPRSGPLFCSLRSILISRGLSSLSRFYLILSYPCSNAGLLIDQRSASLILRTFSISTSLVVTSRRVASSLDINSVLLSTSVQYRQRLSRSLWS